MRLLVRLAGSAVVGYAVAYWVGGAGGNAVLAVVAGGSVGVGLFLASGARL